MAKPDPYLIDPDDPGALAALQALRLRAPTPAAAAGIDAAMQAIEMYRQSEGAEVPRCPCCGQSISPGAVLSDPPRAGRL